MEPPVSPAAPTKRTWVFAMLGGRYRSDRYQEKSWTVAEVVFFGWDGGDSSLIDERWEVEMNLKGKRRNGTAEQGNQALATL
jgi:hypothetical protein